MLMFARNWYWLRCMCCLAVAVPAMLCGTARAGDAQATFDNLFGKSLRAVRATRDTADDVDLALELLAAARVSGEYPELLSILCGHVYDLTAGLDNQQELAVAAMTLLAEAVPQESVEALRKVVILRQRRYEASRGLAERHAAEELIDSMIALAEGEVAADQVSTAVDTMAQAQRLAREAAPNREVRLFEASERMNVRQQALQRAEQYLARLETDPSDSGARTALVRLEVMEMSDPITAARYVDGSINEFLQTYVPLAASGADELSPSVAMELGAWYAHLADGAEAPVAAAVLRRAIGCYQRVLADEGATEHHSDAGRLLRQARGGLAGESGMPLEAGKYHELTDRLDLRADVLAGRWQVLKQGVRSPRRGQGRLRLPVMVAGSYMLEVWLTRTDNSGMATITLPVADREVLLVVDSSGLSGLELIDGQTALNGPTAVVGRKLTNGRDYKLTVKVAVEGEQAVITVRVDGRTWISWAGGVESLSAPRTWSGGQAGAVVIGSSEAEWNFGSIRLTTADPACRRLR